MGLTADISLFCGNLRSYLATNYCGGIVVAVCVKDGSSMIQVYISNFMFYGPFISLETLLVSSRCMSECKQDITSPIYVEVVSPTHFVHKLESLETEGMCFRIGLCSQVSSTGGSREPTSPIQYVSQENLTRFLDHVMFGCLNGPFSYTTRV